NLGFGGRAFMGFGQSPEQQQAVERVMAGMEGLIIGLGVMGVISMVVSVVLLVGGVQLLRRKSAGVPVHRAWAAARIVLGLIECVLVYFFQSAVMKASIESMPTRKGGPPPDQLASCMNLSMGCGILVTLAIVLAYPVTVLIVLARPWARDEVQRWKAAEAGTPSGLQF
ncbi:MAG TPA: hypothetical protein VFF65_11485, partial [Phycisphaerales bacterium]|nr:hypothetical protein [Phycisphaerales bacterium]